MLKRAAYFFLVLTLLPLPTQAEPMALREIKVEAAVSPGFQALPEWRSDFERRLTYASRIFESEFKIKFKLLRYVKWTPANEKAGMPAMLDDLRNAAPLTEADIVIGLTHYSDLKDPSKVKDLHTLGQARPFTGHVVIRYPANKLLKVQLDTVLVHELGHVFGAVHTKDKNSIMSPVVERQLPSRFDKENREIILKTRAINFKQGAESLPKNVLSLLLQSYLKLIATNKSADFFYSLGLFYLQLGQPDDTIKAWKMAVSLEPENPELHFNLGALYFKKGETDRSIPELSQAVSGLKLDLQKPMLFAALSMLGQAYFDEDNLFAANNAWTRAAALRPGDPEIEANLAMIRMKQGQTDNAAGNFEQVLKKDPQNVKALIALGQVKRGEGQNDEALRYFELALKVLNAQPRSAGQIGQLATVYGEIGALYFKMNKKKEAYEHFQAACDLAPTADCHKQLGMTLFNAKDWDGAAREFAMVLQQNKEDTDIYGMLGTALVQKGDDANAIGVFREGLRYARQPQVEARFRRNIGNLFISNKNYQLAEPEFRMALAKDWSDMESHFGLAVSLLGLNQPVAAVGSLKDVLRLDPDNQRAKAMLATIEQNMRKASA